MVDIEGRDSQILNRFDFTIEEQIDKAAFSKALDKQLRTRQKPQATQSQVDNLFDTFDLTTSQFPAAGIFKSERTIFGKRDVRFGIKGFQGAFGLTKAIKFFKFGKF